MVTWKLGVKAKLEIIATSTLTPNLLIFLFVILPIPSH